MNYVSPYDREDLLIFPSISKVFAYQDGVLLYTPMGPPTANNLGRSVFSEDVSEYVPVEFDTLTERELDRANKALEYFKGL